MALVVCGLGIGSLVSDTSVIDTPGLGPIPGVVGVGAATAALAAITLASVRSPHPSYVTAVWTALGAYLAYVVGTGVAVLVVSGELAQAVAVPGRLAIGWQGVVVALAAAVAGWSAVALRRTRAARPHWPWEDDED